MTHKINAIEGEKPGVKHRLDTRLFRAWVASTCKEDLINLLVGKYPFALLHEREHLARETASYLIASQVLQT